MAIYICDKCDEHKDDDYDPPISTEDYELLCVDCSLEEEEE